MSKKKTLTPKVGDGIWIQKDKFVFCVAVVIRTSGSYLWAKLVEDSNKIIPSWDGEVRPFNPNDSLDLLYSNYENNIKIMEERLKQQNDIS